MVSTFDCAFSPELPPELESGEVGVLAAGPLAAEEDEYAQPTEGHPTEEDEKQRKRGRTARVASSSSFRCSWTWTRLEHGP